LIEYLKTLPFVKIEDKEYYDPEFVKKIKKAEKEIQEGDFKVYHSKHR